MLKVRNFSSYCGQIASIINKSKLLRLNILSVDFHPFFMTSEGDIDAAKIRAFRFLSKHWMINHAVLYPLVLFGLCVCVSTIHMRYVCDTQLFPRAYASLGRVPFSEREFINV